MSVQRELLAATKTRSDRKSNLAERGRWNSTNSGAFLRGPSPDKGTGQATKAKINFFTAITKDLMPAVAKDQKIKNAEEVNFGKASWLRANKAQREQWAYAIKNNYAFEGDSPYFRQGVAIAYTEALSSQYGQDMLQAYEKWGDKNNAESGAFDDWINSEDEKFQHLFENIDDEILATYFLPAQDQVRDKLRSMHTLRLNDNYRTESYYNKENQIFTQLRDFFDSVYEEKTRSVYEWKDLIVRGQENHQFNFEKLVKFEELINMKSPTKKDFQKSLGVDLGNSLWTQYSELAKERKEKGGKKFTPILVTIPSWPEGSLEKIAKANKTTVAKLQELNKNEDGTPITNEQLKAGESIRVK